MQWLLTHPGCPGTEFLLLAGSLSTAHVHANFKSSEARLTEIISKSNYSIYNLELIPLVVSNKSLMCH